MAYLKQISGPSPGTSVPIRDGDLIGSGPDCGVYIPIEGLPRALARVRTDATVFWLEVLVRGSVWVNGATGEVLELPEGAMVAVPQARVQLSFSVVPTLHGEMPPDPDADGTVLKADRPARATFLASSTVAAPGNEAGQAQMPLGARARDALDRVHVPDTLTEPVRVGPRPGRGAPSAAQPVPDGEYRGDPSTLELAPSSGANRQGGARRPPVDERALKGATPTGTATPPEFSEASSFRSPLPPPTTEIQLSRPRMAPAEPEVTSPTTLAKKPAPPGERTADVLTSALVGAGVASLVCLLFGLLVMREMPSRGAPLAGPLTLQGSPAGVTVKLRYPADPSRHPSGAMVELSSVVPANIHNLPAGTAITLQADVQGYRPYVAEIVLKEGTAQSANVSLEPAAR